MNTREESEFVEQPVLIRPDKAERRGVRHAFWKPKWIGEHYRIKTLSMGLGEGVRLATHWRRGHPRMQRFGKGLSQTKKVWIEPVLINA